MSIVLLRTLVVAVGVWLYAFNRWCMVDPDDRAKLRRGGWLFLGLVGTPLVLVAILPEIMDGLSWVLFILFLLLEAWRIGRQAMGFTTTRSAAVPVAGLPARLLSTKSLQVRSWQFPGAPEALDGLTVAFLSDLHCNGLPAAEWYDKIWETVRAIGPDLLLLGGDFAESIDDLPFFERCLQGLSRLSPPMGMFAVLGNHDETAPDQIRGILRRAGVTILDDSWRALARADGRTVILHGTSAPYHGSKDPLRGLPPGGADISLVHTPDVAPQLAKAGSRYILAGHLHGGQFGLPLVGALLVPSRYSRRWSYGGFRLGHANLVVTSGIGSVGIPLRIIVRPEIVVVRFHA